LRRSFNEDIIINLLGFLPLGFILDATLIKLGRIFEKRYLLITVSFCFTASLIIEIAQAWIPSRSSDILDLILNTPGALIGAIILKFFIISIFSKRVMKTGD
jgi:glycopeptide antibiotics resistance protein